MRDFSTPLDLTIDAVERARVLSFPVSLAEGLPNL
jgi:hypothetical protein